MSRHRFFLPAPLEASVAEEPPALPLSPSDLHHAAVVLRLAAGQEIVVVEPDGRASVVLLTDIDREAASGRIVETLPASREPRVTLFQGLAKGDKLDLVVEKLTEIGVAAIVPVAFARSVVRLDAERAAKRTERLRRVAAAAAKQSQRAFVPSVAEPVDVSDLPALLSGFDLALVAWEDAEGAPGIAEAFRAARLGADAAIAMVVGPEGGLTEAEVSACRAAGAVTVSLGDTVLRTETAGILSAALCVYESGGLGGRVCD